MSAKYIFVTGGVVSSLGKGLAAASIGALLEARGFKINLMKFDPYLNVDPGTMSPFQHGEVFVTDDARLRQSLKRVPFDNFQVMSLPEFLAAGIASAGAE